MNRQAQPDLRDSADGFAQAFIALRGLADDVVQPAGFLPEAELADVDPAGDVFAGAADESEFEVVNDPRPVGGDVGDQPSFDQVDDVARETQLNGVTAEHGDDWGVVSSGGEDGGDLIGEKGISPSHWRTIKISTIS